MLDEYFNGTMGSPLRYGLSVKRSAKSIIRRIAQYHIWDKDTLALNYTPSTFRQGRVGLPFTKNEIDLLKAHIEYGFDYTTTADVLFRRDYEVIGATRAMKNGESVLGRKFFEMEGDPISVNTKLRVKPLHTPKMLPPGPISAADMMKVEGDAPLESMLARTLEVLRDQWERRQDFEDEEERHHGFIDFLNGEDLQNVREWWEDRRNAEKMQKKALREKALAKLTDEEKAELGIEG